VAQRIVRLGRLLAGLFGLLLAYLAIVQVVMGPQVANSPLNPRLAIAAQQTRWGRILDRHLGLLADSQDVGGHQVRRYSAGRLFAHILGYRSMQHGLAGVESRYDPDLLGLPARDPWRVFQDATGQPSQGNDLVLTVDAAVQQAAASALGDSQGAIVALDPRSGAVLALVSQPSFDPDAIDTGWSAILADPASPLVDRATQGQYPPGSSFKTITLAAALHGGRVTEQTVFECPGSLRVAGATIGDANGAGHGRVTVRQAFALSCNVAFVQIGLKTGADAILGMARAFGLGSAPPFDLPAAPGHLPDSRILGTRGLAQVAFGQGSLLVTPLQMALVAATIANHGVIMRPFLLSQLRTPRGRILRAYAQRGSREVLPPSLAAEIAQDMVSVVDNGTGAAARIPGIRVAGKTGTAENPRGQADAWFLAFAPADHPSVAVAVLLENAGRGGEVAAPAAQQVLRAALRSQDAEGRRP
jgi:penicillin-binding protein A